MNFGALSRGFGTCCLRFKNRVATIPAKLASGWLARLYREGVEPSGLLQKVSDYPSSFSGLSLAQGKFHSALPEHWSTCRLAPRSRTPARLTLVAWSATAAQLASRRPSGNSGRLIAAHPHGP